jgi:hypothetical protein
MTTNNTTTIYGPDGTVLSTANTSDLLARIAGLEARIAAVGTIKKVRAINKPYRTPIYDTVTKKQYESKAQCAKDINKAEWEKNHFYFEVMNIQFPGRFIAQGHIEKKPFAPAGPVIDTTKVAPANTIAPANTTVPANPAPVAEVKPVPVTVAQIIPIPTQAK